MQKGTNVATRLMFAGHRQCVQSVQIAHRTTTNTDIASRLVTCCPKPTRGLLPSQQEEYVSQIMQLANVLFMLRGH